VNGFTLLHHFLHNQSALFFSRRFAMRLFVGKKLENAGDPP